MYFSFFSFSVSLASSHLCRVAPKADGAGSYFVWFAPISDTFCGRFYGVFGIRVLFWRSFSVWRKSLSSPLRLEFSGGVEGQSNDRKASRFCGCKAANHHPSGPVFEVGMVWRSDRRGDVGWWSSNSNWDSFSCRSHFCTPALSFLVYFMLSWELFDSLMVR